MAFSMEEKFQRELNFAVIDEVDSILIDEARTPLIISGQAEDSSKLYTEINKLIPRLEQHIEEVEGEVTKPGHYTIDEKTRQVELNESGHQFVEDMLTQIGLLAWAESLTLLSQTHAPDADFTELAPRPGVTSSECRLAITRWEPSSFSEAAMTVDRLR